MKKIILLFVVCSLLSCTFAPVSAISKLYDLKELPDLGDKLLETYMDITDSNDVSGIELEYVADANTRNQLAKKVYNLIKEIEFVPEENYNYDTNDFLLLMHFCPENWENDISADIYHVQINKDGMYVNEWNRKSNEEHSAFVLCDTDELISEIKVIMQDTVEAEKERVEVQNAEIDKYKSDVSAFKKLYSAVMPALKFEREYSEVLMDAEVGVCSYEMAESTYYACYINMCAPGKSNSMYYISDNIDENNTVYFYDLLYLYKDGDSYYLFEGETLKKNLTVCINIDEDEKVGGINIEVLNSGFKANVKRENITENGKFKDWGQLKFTYSAPAGDRTEEIEEDKTRTEIKDTSANENEGMKETTEKEEETNKKDTEVNKQPEQQKEDSAEQKKEINTIILEIGRKEALVLGKVISNDVAPKIINNRTMLPIRFVAEAMGANVKWSEEERKVLIAGSGVNIEITIGSSTAYVNGRGELLDSPAFIENDRTYVPLRFVSENLGAQVEWNEEEQKVTINF